jgi:hypothetical protein
MERRDCRQPLWQRGVFRDLVALGLLMALCLLFFWPILTPNPDDRGSFRAGDFYVQTYACSTYTARELLNGQLPLWNPYVNSGHPFLADVQNSPLYPANLITILFSAPWGYSVLALELEAIAHFFLAGVFTYFLGRRLFRQRGVALVTAAVFTFGGYLTSFPPLQLPILETAIWLPLILLLLDLGVEKLAGRSQGGPGLAPGQSSPQGRSTSRGLLYCMMGGVVLAVAILAGHPQTALYLLYVAAAWYAFRAWGSGAIARLPLVVGFLAFVGVGGGLSAVQLLPAVELMRLSIRASAAYQDLASGFALRDLIQIVLPRVTGVWSPLYVGVFPLTWVLFAWSVWFKRDITAPSRQWRRSVGFWTVMAMLALLLTLGGETFLFGFFYLGVPGFDLFRSQERIALVFSLSLALLAGYGLQHFMVLISQAQDRRTSYVILSRLTLALLAVAGCLTLLLYLGQNQAGGDQGRLLQDTMGLTLFVGLLLAANWLWIFVGTHRSWHIGPALGLLLALVIFDLFTFHAPTNIQSRRPERQVSSSALIQALQAAEEDRPFRVHHGGWHLLGNYGCIFGVEDTLGASQLQLASYARFLEQVPQERAWDMLNVRYVVTWQAQLHVPSEVTYHTTTRRGDDVYLHRLEADTSRAWVAFRGEMASDDQALELLSQPDFDRYGIALLDTPVDPPLPSELGQAQVRFTSFSAEHLQVTVDTSTRGILVLSELYYPGWQAWLDGQEVPIRRANTLLRAVEVPAGTHLVEMRFRPLSVYLGTILSLLTGVLLLGYTVWALALWRRADSGPDCSNITEAASSESGGYE